MGLKITVVGGGSSYTPELFANLVDLRGLLDVDQVVLFDPNQDKLAFVAVVCERLLAGSGLATKVVIARDREQALAGADFILLQVRVGGLAARVRDERLPMALGMLGNETTGAGGFVCALRTVPVALEIARLAEKLAPDAWLLNLSNPAGIVTETVFKHSRMRALGFCNIPINTTYALAEALGVPPDGIRLDSFGLNHLSWVRGAYVDGEERLQPLLAKTLDRNSPLYQAGVVDILIDPDWLRNLGLIPGWYVRYFHYQEAAMDEERQDLQVKGETDRIAEQRLGEIYTSQGYTQEARQILESKGGARYYLPVLQAIRSIVEDRRDEVVVDLRNDGAIPDLPDAVCVEIPARIGRQRVEPLAVGPLPLNVRGLVQAVKAYEELTVQAAVCGDREVAIEALVANPLVGSYPKASAFFERVLENERPYLPQFFSAT
jgi:6-phospho-beta-glucosidase